MNLRIKPFPFIKGPRPGEGKGDATLMIDG